MNRNIRIQIRLLVRLHIEEKQMEHPLIRSGFQRDIFVQWNDCQLIPRRDGAGLTDFHVLDHQLNQHTLIGTGGVGDLDGSCRVGQGDRDLIGIGDVHCAAALGLGRERIALVMETICSTGIRVGEVRYITVEAVRAGSATISLKGKIRTILLPGKLCKKLLKYARKQKIISGEIFLTGGGKPMSRCQIWAEMKRICKAAGVDSSKVFPHNLRHLFATVYYRIYKDIVKLADILGHSSVETTRIYLLTTGQEHRRQLERLKLVL